MPRMSKRECDVYLIGLLKKAMNEIEEILTDNDLNAIEWQVEHDIEQMGPLYEEILSIVGYYEEPEPGDFTTLAEDYGVENYVVSRVKDDVEKMRELLQLQYLLIVARAKGRTLNIEKIIESERRRFMNKAERHKFRRRSM